LTDVDKNDAQDLVRQKHQKENPMYRIIRLFVIVFVVMLVAGCAFVNLGSLMGKRDLSESTVEKDSHWFVSDKVLLVDISGVIAEGAGGGLLSLGGATCSPDYVRAVLVKARKDSLIRAVVLRIDSPGGTVTASELIAREIKRYRQETGIPVYAQITGLGCSGGYYIAAACDRIHIQKAGITGSIGVIASFPNYRKLADKVGYDQTVVKSGDLKDIGSPMRPMNDEEKAVFQAMINESYVQFLAWIVANRPQVGNVEVLKPIADGRIYTAEQALKNHLVDQIAFLDETLEAVKQAAKISRADIITYGYNLSEDANMYTPSAAAKGLRLTDVELPLPARRAGMYYLWGGY
jgi:protease-4